MPLRVDLDARRVLRTLGAVPTFVRREITTRFRLLGRTLRDDLRATIPKRSGKARRGVGVKMDRARERGDIAVLIYGTLGKAPHLKTLEQGATLKPTRATMLAVPIGRAATKHGQARFRARDLRDNPSAYGYERSFVRGDVVFGVRGRDLEPLFALRRNLVFPRRSYFKKFYRANEARIRREVELAVAGGVEAAQHAGGLG